MNPLKFRLDNIQVENMYNGIDKEFRNLDEALRYCEGLIEEGVDRFYKVHINSYNCEETGYDTCDVSTFVDAEWR